MTTIRDVARICGVSPMTVTNVLHGRNAKVRPETRERVLQAVRDLNYKPPAYALDDSPFRHRTIGFVIPLLEQQGFARNSYTEGLLSELIVQSCMIDCAVNVIVDSITGTPRLSTRFRYDGRCDGFVVVSPEGHDEVVEKLLERAASVVVVGSRSNIPGAPTVDIDYTATMLNSIEHLVGLGHRRIGYLDIARRYSASYERLDGYLNGLAESGRRVGQELIPWVTQWSDADDRVGNTRTDSGSPVVHWGDGARALVEAYERCEPSLRPTAFIGFNDYAALEACNALTAAGYRCPDHYSIIGCDDTDRAKLHQPRLASYAMPYRQLVSECLKLLTKAIQEPGAVQGDVLLQAEFIEGASTAALSSDAATQANHKPTR